MTIGIFLLIAFFLIFPRLFKLSFGIILIGTAALYLLFFASALGG